MPASRQRRSNRPVSLTAGEASRPISRDGAEIAADARDRQPDHVGDGARYRRLDRRQIVVRRVAGITRKSAPDASAAPAPYR